MFIIILFIYTNTKLNKSGVPGHILHATDFIYSIYICTHARYSCQIYGIYVELGSTLILALYGNNM